MARMVSLANHCAAHRNFYQHVTSVAKRARESSHFVAKNEKRRSIQRDVSIISSTRILLDAHHCPSLFAQSSNNSRWLLGVLPSYRVLRAERGLCNIFLRPAKTIDGARRVTRKIDLGR